MVWPFTRKSNVVPLSSHGRMTQQQEDVKLKSRIKEADREIRRLVALHKKFSKQLGNSRETVHKEEQWKRRVISMEHEASQIWYRLAEALADIERLGIELVANIEAEKRYNEEMKGKPQEYGPKVYAEVLRQEIADLEREELSAIKKQNPELQQWWEEQVKEVRREHMSRVKGGKAAEKEEWRKAA